MTPILNPRTMAPMVRDAPRNIIGHDHPFGQFDIWKMVGHLPPAIIGEASRLIQNHGASHNGSEPMSPVLGTHGDEIGPRLGIIIAAQTDRTALPIG